MQLLTPVIFIALLLSGTGTARAQEAVGDSAIADTIAEPRYVVRLPRLNQTTFPELDTLVMTIATTDAELGGFDFKIATDSRILTIVDILPGALQDSCGWEYFAARDLGLSLAEEPISSLWKVVGLARSASDTLLPSCDTLPGGATLARLVVAYNPMVDARDSIAEFFFYWESCADNTVSASSGRRMSISRQVHDFVATDRERVGGFPTRTGAPKQCVKPGAHYHPLRQVDFHNGGVRLVLPAPPDSAATADDSTDESTSDK